MSLKACFAIKVDAIWHDGSQAKPRIDWMAIEPCPYSVPKGN